MTKSGLAVSLFGEGFSRSQAVAGAGDGQGSRDAVEILEGAL